MIFVAVGLSVIGTCIKDLFSDELGDADASAWAFLGFIVMIALNFLIVRHPNWAALHIIACIAISVLLVAVRRYARATASKAITLWISAGLIILAIAFDLAIIYEQPEPLAALNAFVFIIYVPLFLAALPFITYRAVRRFKMAQTT